jgi:hypothetical protein
MSLVKYKLGFYIPEDEILQTGHCFYLVHIFAEKERRNEGMCEVLTVENTCMKTTTV